MAIALQPASVVGRNGRRLDASQTRAVTWEPV